MGWKDNGPNKGVQGVSTDMVAGDSPWLKMQTLILCSELAYLDSHRIFKKML
jgi:hypothetical protein